MKQEQNQLSKKVSLQDKKFKVNKPSLILQDEQIHKQRFNIYQLKQESSSILQKSISTIQTSQELQIRLQQIEDKDWQIGMYRISSATFIFDSFMNSQQFVSVSFAQDPISRKQIFKNEFIEPNFDIFN